MNEAYFETATNFNPILGDEGVFFNPDGSTTFRLKGETARDITIMADFQKHPMTKNADGVWELTLSLKPGFWYLFVLVDGVTVVHPALPVGYGYAHPINFVNVPGPEDDFWLCKDVPHGTVTQDYFFSNTTHRTETCHVYLPPSYFSAPERKYPVLYLQHGMNENETGWVHQGKVNFILDNLIAEGKAEEMLIVMANGMVQVDGKVDNEAYRDFFVRDLRLFAEGRYRVIGDRAHRAMAGLSMGSMQTSYVTMTHPELYSAIGLFSGFLRNLFDKGPAANPHLAALNDPKKFREQHPIFFRAMGKDDQYLDTFLEDDEILRKAGIESDRRVYEGAHVWQVWRECARDFLQLIFR